MKKRLVIVALLVIGIAILSAGTIAYFTSQDTAHNVITSGGVKITLDEWMDEVGGTPYPAEPVEVMPGTSVTKIVTVKNQDADAYVRARFDVIIRNRDGKEVKPENHEEAVQMPAVPNGSRKGTGTIIRVPFLPMRSPSRCSVKSSSTVPA